MAISTSTLLLFAATAAATNRKTLGCVFRAIEGRDWPIGHFPG
jgi:hypothetical protein